MKLKSLIISLLLIFTLACPTFAETFTDIIVSSPNGIWTDSRAYATLNAAITAVGANERTITISSPQTVTTLTVPSNVTLRFERDGAINNSGQLTINTKKIEAPNHQIFTGAGDIDFAVGSVVKSAWFSSFVDAINVTADDELTLIVSNSAFITANCAVGNNVTLKWESARNRLTANAGCTLSNISKIEAGNYQLFAGAGDFDFTVGSVINTSWFSSFRMAVAFTSDELVDLTLLVTNPSTVDFNTTLTVHQGLNVTHGAILTISPGVTITINGQFYAGLYQVFSGTGVVIFGLGSVKEAYPQWWGAKAKSAPDQTADDTKAIQAMLDSGASKGIIPDGYYMVRADVVPVGHIKEGLNLPSNFELILSPGTHLQALNMDNDNSYNVLCAYNKSNVVVKGNGATLVGDSDNSAHKPGVVFNGIGLRVQGCTDVWVYDLRSTKMWADGFTIIYDDLNSPYPDSINVNLIRCIGTENYRNGASVIGAIRGGIFGGSYDNNSGTAPQDGIDVEPNADRGDGNPSTVHDFILDGVMAHGNTQHGIELYGAGTILNVDVMHSHAFSNGSGGFVVRSAKRVNLIGNHAYSNAGMGISVYHAQNINIDENIANDNGLAGIIVQNPSGVATQYISVSGNKTFNNGNQGIYLAGSAGKIIQDINISRNISSVNSQTTDNTADNIYAVYVTNGVFSNNITRHGGGANQARYGINIASSCTNCSLINNDTTSGGRTGNILNSSTTTPFTGLIRQSLLVLNNGTAAATIKPSVSSICHGDTIASTDNVSKGATTGNFTLSADGSELTIENSGLTGAVMVSVSAQVTRNFSAVDLALAMYTTGGDMRIVFYNSTTGAIQDVTTLVDTGQIQILLTYMLEN